MPNRLVVRCLLPSLSFSVLLPLSCHEDAGSSSGSGGVGAAGGTAGSSGTSDAVWFSDGFEDEASDDWNLMPGEDAKFAIVQEPGESNHVLRYTAGSTTDNLIALMSDAAWQKTTANAGVEELRDYYFEARIKPQNNGITSNKQIYLVGRYQDEDNWYLTGLNVQNSTASTRIEAGSRKGGTITRPLQVSREIVQGDQGTANGEWYRVRLELIGETLTAYLDGENVGSVSDADFSSGKVGLFTANKSFLIDDVEIGDPALKPVSLTLDPALSTWEANTESDPLTLHVNAVKSDGQSADSFSASSSDESVVVVSEGDGSVTLTAAGQGSADVSVVSDSDPRVVRRIHVTVSPAYEDSTATYASLAELTEPAAGEPAAYVDTRLRLSFDDPPTLGSSGSIRIFRADDDSLVDVISVGEESAALGPASGTNDGRVRVVRTHPVSIEGSTVSIAPHQGVLDYDTEYYVGISANAFSGTLGGDDFAGIGQAAEWTFTTRAEPPTGPDVSVDDDGTSADFRTLQGALSYVMQTQDADTPARISVADGVYRELLFLRNKNNLTITGESQDGVVIEYENYEGLNGGTGSSSESAAGTGAGGRSLLLVENADLLTLDTLTLHNTHSRTGSGDQAEALYYNSGLGRLVAKRATFLSEQDTLQTKGYAWFYDCLVAGNTDFIWGANRVTLFENSEIRMLGDPRSNAPSGGFLVQARSVVDTDKGFVFLNSLLSHAPNESGTEVASGEDAETYLARSAGNASYYDNVAYIGCRIDDHVPAVGWADPTSSSQPAPNPPTASAESGWKEYGSTDLEGEPLDLADRSEAAYILSDEEYEAGYASRELIFSAYSGGSGWNPEP